MRRVARSTRRMMAPGCVAARVARGLHWYRPWPVSLLVFAMLLVGCGQAHPGLWTARPRIGPELPGYFPAPQRNFGKHVATWRQTQSQNVMLQRREYTCGAASLGTLLTYYYQDTRSEEDILDASLGKLDEDALADRVEHGLSMEDLARGASQLGYSAAVLEMDYAKLKGLPAPVVVRLIDNDFKHFVVYRGELDGRVFLADPLRGNVRMPVHSFVRQWDGNVLGVARRGMRPRATHPLQVDQRWPVTPENQAARRSVIRVPDSVRGPR